MEHPILSWEAYEYHHKPRGADWYWSLGIIAVAIAILAILMDNILFGIFILIAAISGGIYVARKPKVIRIELHQKGVVIEDMVYRYNTLNSFWIDEHHFHHPRLIVASKRIFAPHIVILIDHVSSEDIRNYLLNHLPEEHHKDSIFHQLFERMGF